MTLLASLSIRLCFCLRASTPCSLQPYIGFIVKMDLLMMLQSLSALKLHFFFPFPVSHSPLDKDTAVTIAYLFLGIGPLLIKPSASLVDFILLFNVSLYVASYSVAVNAHVFCSAIEKKSGWVFMYLCTYLCMNDCTPPVHLNSILHITSTLIWAIKCAVDLCIFVIFDAVQPSAIRPWTSSVSSQRQ